MLDLKKLSDCVSFNKLRPGVYMPGHHILGYFTTIGNSA